MLIEYALHPQSSKMGRYWSVACKTLPISPLTSSFPSPLLPHNPCNCFFVPIKHTDFHSCFFHFVTLRTAYCTCAHCSAPCFFTYPCSVERFHVGMWRIMDTLFQLLVLGSCSLFWRNKSCSFLFCFKSHPLYRDIWACFLTYLQGVVLPPHRVPHVQVDL